MVCNKLKVLFKDSTWTYIKLLLYLPFVCVSDCKKIKAYTISQTPRTRIQEKIFQSMWKILRDI